MDLRQLRPLEPQNCPVMRKKRGGKNCEKMEKSIIRAAYGGLDSDWNCTSGKTYAASEGMDGLKTVVNSGVGKMVDDKSTIDGSYDFAPIIGADTKITFGSTDGTMWDNTFCTKGQEHAKIITQWWPLADIGASGNTRSFTPYESLKGKMYAEYTNVGNANGLPVTMRIWFLTGKILLLATDIKMKLVQILMPSLLQKITQRVVPRRLLISKDLNGLRLSLRIMIRTAIH